MNIGEELEIVEAPIPNAEPLYAPADVPAEPAAVPVEPEPVKEPVPA